MKIEIITDNYLFQLFPDRVEASAQKKKKKKQRYNLLPLDAQNT